MAQQSEITKFFHVKTKMSQKDSNGSSKRIAVRPMTELCKTPEKLRRSADRAQTPKPTPSTRHNDTISLLTSDEDQENSIEHSSNLSAAFTPNKVSQPIGHPGSSAGSPSKKSFYSPTKKRSVKRSPKKREFNSPSVTPKKLFCNDDDLYTKACQGQDDKTKFLLYIAHQYLKDESQAYLLGVEAGCLLQRYLRASTLAARIVCRLYWWKQRWYRDSKLLKIVDTNKDSVALKNMFCQLLEEGFIVEGNMQNMELEDYTNGLLTMEELKKICKFLKIKNQSKKDCIAQLQAYCKSSNNIATYFTTHQRNNTANNKARVLELLSEAAGRCYKLSERCREVLNRLHLLSYLGIDPDVLRNKQLELLLINVKTKQETFPIDPELVDKPTLVFPTHESFESYVVAHNMYQNFLLTTDSAEKISIVKQAHILFNDLPIEQYRSLPPWLRHYTPAYLYVRIIEEGLPELKKGKERASCALAADMLSALLAQDLFRQHRRAAWYNERALLLQNYLHLPDQAAAVLLEALSSELPEEAKDQLRPRAKKLGAQKNIALDEKLRAVLLAHGTKDYILESSLPATHFYRQQMENTTKGKVLFEGRTENGRTISSVEEVAIAAYLETGEYTHGQHWEGRMVTTLFFLLFWDIIYSKPKDVKGIFLCPFQRYPLDMFHDTFYQSRKRAIDERLRCIENCSADEIEKTMFMTWSCRPEGERGGIVRELGWTDVAQVARCLGAAPLAALCRRLAHQYKYACSGFPDLTLWHTGTGKIKFAEVKSDSDKPSMKQIQWMQYLLASGVDTELCYVGVRGLHHAAAATSAITLLQHIGADGL